MTIKRLVIASNNSHKTAEMAEYFALLGQKVINYRDLHEQVSFPAESETDMAYNMQMKAETIHNILPNEYILADDSALFIPAIPDHFGVTTMREFKAHQLRGDEEINQYILDQLNDDIDRAGYLQANFYLITPTGERFDVVKTGGIEIASEARGNNGIDALMVTETGQTLGEMPVTERINYAHRGRAAKALLTMLAER